jgi:hypothetical protein
VSNVNQDRRSVNQDRTVNEDRRSPLSPAAELGQALRRDAPAEVIDAYRSQLRTERAETALRRVLDGAPPLTAVQVARLRAVLGCYGPGE